jgi:hypothetical protein
MDTDTVYVLSEGDSVNDVITDANLMEPYLTLEGARAGREVAEDGENLRIFKVSIEEVS